MIRGGDRERDAWASQVRKGVLELAILSVLAKNEMYGSQLVESLSSHRDLSISVGTVYPLLARLKKAGLVDSSWTESPVGPPRKYYRLTDLGRQDLAAMAGAWFDLSESVATLLDDAGVRRAAE